MDIARLRCVTSERVITQGISKCINAPRQFIVLSTVMIDRSWLFCDKNNKVLHGELQNRGLDQVTDERTKLYVYKYNVSIFSYVVIVIIY